MPALQIQPPVARKTYYTAVETIVEEMFRSTDAEMVREIIEGGQIGVREMTNAQLAEEWRAHFGEALHLIDPGANPNA